MAQHLIFRFSILTAGGGFSVGDKIDALYDDVADAVVYTLNGVPYLGTGSMGITSVSNIAYSDSLYSYSAYSYCDGLTKKGFKCGYRQIPRTFPYVSSADIEDSPDCCEINLLAFGIQVQHQTTETPNGFIKITNTSEDINLFEALLNNTLPYVDAAGSGVDHISFEGLAAGEHNVLVRRKGTSCFFELNVTINNIITLIPFQLQVLSFPDEYSPVFKELEYTWKWTANAISIVSGENGGSKFIIGNTGPYKDYYLAQRYIKLADSPGYNGTWNVTRSELIGTDWHIYIDAPYTGPQTAYTIPINKISFDIYAESTNTFANFQKVGRVSTFPDINGVYRIRVEGYLQSVFQLNAPAFGDEIVLGRKFYMQPVVANIYSYGPFHPWYQKDNGGILNAIYAAVDDLTPFVDDLVPLGPVPLNFINEQTGKGLPVLFSIIKTDTGRVSNIVTQSEEDIISTSPIVIINSIPLNNHALKWIAGANIADLQVSPALPSWIQIQAGPANEVNLLIQTYTITGGDYLDDDYDNEDYLVYSHNAIVGCYEFTFSDGATELFKLQICIYPASQINNVCGADAVNIAWVNREGGWSSFIFTKGKKTIGYEIGDVTNYRKEDELKKSSVEGVYKTMTVNYSVLNQRELNFIATLRHSIQAYMYNEDTQRWDIPIYLDTSNFPVMSLPFRQAEVSGQFTFKYANEIKIQRQ